MQSRDTAQCIKSTQCCVYRAVWRNPPQTLNPSPCTLCPKQTQCSVSTVPCGMLCVDRAVWRQETAECTQYTVDKTHCALSPITVTPGAQSTDGTGAHSRQTALEHVHCLQ